MNKNKIDGIANTVVKCAIEVHKDLGPGLLESVYEVCMEHALKKEGLNVRTQVPVPVFYDGVQMDKAFIIDILVEDEIIIELKSVEHLLPIHEAQLINYLKLAEKKLGYLMNFNSPLMKNGIKRRMNGYFD